MGSRQVSEELDWQGKRVTVAGLGVSGIPAARALAARGAVVTVVNDGDDERSRTQAAALEAEGITVRLGDGATLPTGTELVVTTPGWQPDKPLFTAAAEAGVEIWGDVELAWRLRGPDAAPWLAITGTNGKTTTTRMLASILEAAGLRTAAVGNIGVSLLDAVLGDERYDVLAVELSSYQLHWAPSVRAQ
ncbi:Mur ligase family protein, partial [Streptomyces sp. NPDC055051]